MIIISSSSSSSSNSSSSSSSSSNSSSSSSSSTSTSTSSSSDSNSGLAVGARSAFACWLRQVFKFSSLTLLPDPGTLNSRPWDFKVPGSGRFKSYTSSRPWDFEFQTLGFQSSRVWKIQVLHFFQTLRLWIPDPGISKSQGLEDSSLHFFQTLGLWIPDPGTLNSRPWDFKVPGSGRFKSYISSRPWDFELLHAYNSWERWLSFFGLTHDSARLDIGFGTLNVKSCELKLWELTVRPVHARVGWLSRCCEHEQWFCDSRPSMWNLADWNYETWS